MVDYLIPDLSPFAFNPSLSPTSSPVMLCRVYDVIRDDVIENEEDFTITLSANDEGVNFPEMAESTTASVQIRDSSSKYQT